MTVTQLQQQNAELLEQIATLRQQLEEARREAALLRQKIDALPWRCFGKKSEQLSSDQLELLMMGLCHRADQNRPLAGGSKPASLRWEFHNRFTI